MTTRSGASLLVEALQSVGVEVVSGIPGHTNYEFADAAATSELKNIVFRHETSAAFAADAYFRCTGRLMAVFVHSIPGLSNAMAGIANAYTDSSAMLVLVGGTASVNLGRGAYQEFSRQFDDDVPQLLRHAVKRVYQPRRADQIPTLVARAAITAVEGRPGPVALHVPLELLSDVVDLPPVTSVLEAMHSTKRVTPSPKAVGEAVELLSTAKRPLILAGHGVHLSGAHEQLLKFAETQQIPVATSVTGKPVFPNDHPLSVGVIGWVGTAPANYAGNNADVVLAIGARMSESTTSSWQRGVTFDFTQSKLIQADIDTSAIGYPYRADVFLLGDARHALEELSRSVADQTVPDRSGWLHDLGNQVQEWNRSTRPAEASSTEWPVSVGQVVATLRRVLDDPVTIVADVGKAHKWLVHQFEARGGDYIVSSIGGATMGIGAGGAIGAALADSSRGVVSWVGDGAMSMSLSALPTAAEYRLPIAFIILDDNAYGAVTNVQESRFGGRLSYSTFDGGGTNPDYHLDLAGVAEACGIPARRLSDASELEDGVTEATRFDGPRLLVIPVSRKSVAPSGGGSKLSSPWKADFAGWDLDQAIAAGERRAGR